MLYSLFLSNYLALGMLETQYPPLIQSTPNIPFHDSGGPFPLMKSNSLVLFHQALTRLFIQFTSPQITLKLSFEIITCNPRIINELSAYLSPAP